MLKKNENELNIFCDIQFIKCTFHKTFNIITKMYIPNMKKKYYFVL